LPRVEEAAAGVSALAISAGSPLFTSRPSVGRWGDHAAQPLPEKRFVHRPAAIGGVPIVLIVGDQEIQQRPGAESFLFAECPPDAVEQGD
jgi:hypothetical protein